MVRTIIFFFSFLFVNSLIAQDKFIARIQNPEKNIYQNLIKQEYDVLGFKPGSFIDIVVDQAGFQSLKNAGYAPFITQTEEEIKNNLVVGKSLNGYRTYEDLLLELQQIEAANPTICKLYDIGETRGKEYSTGGNSNYDNYNHEVWALKVSDNVNTEEDEPCIFYFGVHHAREPISLEVNMYILNHILANYGTNPGITNSVNNKQIWFIPLVNPNGHKIVTDEWDLWQRKNIADNDLDGQIDVNHADGVDPNRNYGWEWGGGGSSGNTGSETYRGPSPFSEPEIQAVRDLMANHHFVTGITYHSHGELVLYPYGYSSGVSAPDQAALQELAVDMATNIPGLNGGNYTPQASWQLYPADGVTDDYVYGQHGTFSFTVELATQFIPNAGDIITICQDNLQASLILMNRMDKSTLSGLIKDANTLSPLEAEVYIEGIDNTGAYREPYKGDANFGRYYRLLQNGDYDVTFSLYGYIPQTFNNVNINNAGQTILDVFLVPAQTVTVTGTITDLDTGLPIENATVEILGTPLPPVTTDQYGHYTITNMMEGTYDFRVYALDYATIIQEGMVSVGNTVFDFQLQESFAWSFEPGSFEPQWSFGGNAPWVISTEDPYDGIYCVKSGAIGHQQTSEMEITLDLMTGGDVSFFRKVSSEANYDFLRFFIDGNLQGEWSGEVDWSEVNFPVALGTHTFKWTYNKDQYVANGSDCGWVDYIIFPPLAGPAEIGLNALSFEVTLPQDENTTEILTISNAGEAELSFSFSKDYQTDAIKAYCTSVGGGNDEFIENVTIGTINNTTGQSDYADYTAMSTVVNVGEPYLITITNGDPQWSTDECGIWVDWNQNENFLDDEPIVVFDTPGVGPYTATITPPLDALPGLARMRVQIRYAATPDPCASFSWGETEDYSLNVNSNFVDWLTIDPMAGTVAGSGSSDINFTFDATGLDEGDYFVTALITNNDPGNPVINVPCTLHVENGISVSIKVNLEGPYTGTGMATSINNLGLIPLSQPFGMAPWNYSGTENVAALPDPDVVDWTLIELRETTGDVTTALPSSVVARQAGFVLKDGTIINTEGNPTLRFNISITNNLFIVVYHLNHLGIISANFVTASGGIYDCDFRSGAAQAFGGALAQKEISTGVWGMISGDANGDGIISGLDLTDNWENNAGLSGYEPGDLNLDGQVDNKDKDDFWYPNEGKGTYIPQ